MGCLYMLTSPSGKSYIGISRNTAKQRFRGHVNTTHPTAIHLAILKYGEKAFTPKTLLIADDLDYLKEMERRAIASFGTVSPKGYNLTGGGDGSAWWCPESMERAKAGMRRAMLNPSEKRKAGWARAAAAMSVALKDPAKESDRRSKISATMKARSAVPEARARLKAICEAAWADPNTRAVLVADRRKPRDAARLSRQSEAQRESWAIRKQQPGFVAPAQRPEVRAKISATTRAQWLAKQEQNAKAKIVA